MSHAAHRTIGFMAWIRSLRPFDRRAIREPAERDVYWTNLQRRLAESDAAFLKRDAVETRKRRVN